MSPFVNPPNGPEASILNKIHKDREGLVLQLSKARPRVLVFTNGCFDILHRGHVSYLARARALGDALVVGLNSDSSVHKLKGEGRPVHRWEDRAYVLAGLSSTDYIVYFNEDTPAETLELLRPNIHCKGGDYRPEELPEKGVLDSYGGRIEILSFVEGHSTSSILKHRPGE